MEESPIGEVSCWDSPLFPGFNKKGIRNIVPGFGRFLVKEAVRKGKGVPPDSDGRRIESSQPAPQRERHIGEGGKTDRSAGVGNVSGAAPKRGEGVTI